MTTNIYILRLQGGRFYVGKSADTTLRYQEHLAGTASTWTRKYKPLALERVITNASPFDEDRYTKELMMKYGINRVRGGAYVSEELDEIQEEALRREIWGAMNKCTRCGRLGHFVKDCYARTDVEGNEFLSESDSESDSESTILKISSPIPTYNPFYSLRSTGAIQAPSKVVKKEVISRGAIQAPSKVVKKEVISRGAIQAPNKVVKKEVISRGAIQAPSKSPTCFRCGRPGHYSPDCYARTHIRGYELDSDSD